MLIFKIWQKKTSYFANENKKSLKPHVLKVLVIK